MEETSPLDIVINNTLVGVQTLTDIYIEDLTNYQILQIGFCNLVFSSFLFSFLMLFTLIFLTCGTYIIDQYISLIISLLILNNIFFITSKIICSINDCYENNAITITFFVITILLVIFLIPVLLNYLSYSKYKNKLRKYINKEEIKRKVITIEKGQYLEEIYKSLNGVETNTPNKRKYMNLYKSNFLKGYFVSGAFDISDLIFIRRYVRIKNKIEDLYGKGEPYDSGGKRKKKRKKKKKDKDGDIEKKELLENKKKNNDKDGDRDKKDLLKNKKKNNDKDGDRDKKDLLKNKKKNNDKDGDRDKKDLLKKEDEMNVNVEDEMNVNSINVSQSQSKKLEYLKQDSSGSSFFDIDDSDTDTDDSRGPSSGGINNAAGTGLQESFNDEVKLNNKFVTGKRKEKKDLNKKKETIILNLKKTNNIESEEDN
eukprot:TRINITY_DN441_c0_g1_i2.p1 TRINITY_DN441_c0_g1~~TRINITY_DN441_c0_g1_i2.p1  ORF type:complete len:426 (+),score=90.28 TRINITY_DN441_c0_g1_i2:30-1307(+)